MDWKRAIREAGRVLKPGGRLLFVEAKEIEGESYLEYLMGVSGVAGGEDAVVDGEGDVVVEKVEAVAAVGEKKKEGEEGKEEEEGEEDTFIPLFDEVGFDDVDMVLQPHVAGVAIKAMDADLTMEEIAKSKNQEEEDRLADIALNAFERGNKRRKRKKKKSFVPEKEEGEK